MALNSVDIFVLACFAVAQPLSRVLSRSEGLFLVHNSHPTEVILLALGAWAVPGAALLLPELVAALFGPRTLRAVHGGILSLLLALILLPLVKRPALLPGVACIAIALACGVALTVPYLRARTWRWSVVYLSPALLLVPGLFVFHSPVSALLWPGRTPETLRARVENPAPVVMVVLDEFPLTSLVRKDGTIDASLYPNFAELAKRGTWYRNATTVSDGTLISVPAILDGEYPSLEHPRLPNTGGHPNSLFTLLGGSYRMNVVENNTRVCPDRLCGGYHAPFRKRLEALAADSCVLWLYAVLPSDLTHGLPDISQTWGDFTAPAGKTPSLAEWTRFDDLTDWRDRLKEFRNFTASIQPSNWPTLHFLHILLPHAPWEYLPSGQRYPIGDGRIRGLRGQNDRGEDPNRWTNDPWAAAQSYQRHLLQVAMVDRLIGELIQHLRDANLYDSSLLVITADHGTSFRPSDSRRYVTPTNHSDIMSVPLFIKYPHQQAGGIDDRATQTIDILPTIADVLKVKTNWKVDGRSLLGKDVQGYTVKRVLSDAGKQFEYKAGLDDLLESVRYKLRVFGDAEGEAEVYRLGDRYGWTGRTPAATAVRDSGVSYQLEREVYYSKVDPGASMLLTNIAGRILHKPDVANGVDRRTVALAINGTIRAVAETYPAGDHDEFSTMVPGAALRPGRNDIGVFLVQDGGTSLERVAPPKTETYRWGTQIVFGATGNVEPYLGAGWSGPEDKIHWTNGHAATLYLPTSEPGTDLTMKARIGAFTSPGKLNSQTIRVLINRHEVATWELTSNFRIFQTPVPKALFAGTDTTEITFDMPDATAPIAIGVNNDSRTLGLAAMWVELDAATGRQP